MKLSKWNRTARPRRPCANWARPRLEGLEDRCLLSPTITEFNVPTDLGLTSITAGPDGNLWFSDQGTNSIGTINPATHAITEFPIPTANSTPQGITAGPDGNIWFTEFAAGKIGMFNLATHAITDFPAPTGKFGDYSPRDITAGPDGNLWFNFTAGIGMINPATHVITEFALPSKDAAAGGICEGPDGNLWFTAENNIGMINPATHAFTEFPIPNDYGAGITEGPDGNVWFACKDGYIGMLNPATGAVTLLPDPSTNALPLTICAGPDGNLWFTDWSGRNIGMINPATDAITEFPIPYPDALPDGITAGPDGNIWFTDFENKAIGVATLTTNADHFAATQQPPSSITAGSPFGLTVQADDRSGNLDSSFNGTVTVGLASDPGGATLGGTLSVTASSGVATFSNLALTQAAAGYTLAVSSSGVDSVTTSAITVTPAVATQLVITQQPPATVKVNSGFGLQASIEDQYGNVVTTANSSVSVAFANNPTGAALGGALTVTASQGIAAFSGLTINQVGSGYTLRVTSSGLSSAVTNAINVTKSGKSSASVAQGGGNVPDPFLAPLVLDSPDLWDGLRFKSRSRSN